MGLSLSLTGSVWAWGWNGSGQLGDGTRVAHSSPVLVVGGHSFVEVVGGDDHSLARKADGSVWAWGWNGSGQLGDETRDSHSSPVLVVGAHSFVEVAGGYLHSLARKADGSVWAWGYNYYGQLGDGTADARSSPVLVVGGHSFVEVAGGGYNHSLARKADGSVWAWGYNGNGELGDGTTDHRSSPVLVVGGHSFVEVAGGGSHSLARTRSTWGHCPSAPKCKPRWSG
jgi:alpha-tubulin suppressor-like RCC1 family protein